MVMDEADPATRWCCLSVCVVCGMLHAMLCCSCCYRCLHTYRQLAAATRVVTLSVNTLSYTGCQCNCCLSLFLAPWWLSMQVWQVCSLLPAMACEEQHNPWNHIFLLPLHGLAHGWSRARTPLCCSPTCVLTAAPVSNKESVWHGLVLLCCWLVAAVHGWWPVSPPGLTT